MFMRKCFINLHMASYLHVTVNVVIMFSVHLFYNKNFDNIVNISAHEKGAESSAGTVLIEKFCIFLQLSLTRNDSVSLLWTW